MSEIDQNKLREVISVDLGALPEKLEFLDVTFSLTAESIENAPKASGVYELLAGDDTIYYGTAPVSIRDCLRRHFAGENGPCTTRATNFRIAFCAKPAAQLEALLMRFQLRHNRLPECNRPHPFISDTDATPQ